MTGPLLLSLTLRSPTAPLPPGAVTAVAEIAGAPVTVVLSDDGLHPRDHAGDGVFVGVLGAAETALPAFLPLQIRVRDQVWVEAVEPLNGEDLFYVEAGPNRAQRVAAPFLDQWRPLHEADTRAVQGAWACIAGGSAAVLAWASRQRRRG